MKKHYETHVEDTDKLISVAGPELDYKSWYEQYRKLMEEQAQRKYGLYTPTSEGDEDDFPSIPGMIARYSALGLTNEQMEQNPVWVDKTGNGHDLQMKNLAWGGMSGVGGYNQNFNQWGYGNLSTATQTHTSYKIELSVPSTLKTANIYSNANSIGKEGDVYDFTLNIVGLKDGALLRITKGVVSGVIERIEKDGIYKIYQPIEAGWDQPRIYIFISNPNLVDLNITIEQLPLYPGALVFDGVDDYGVCDNFPILTKEKGYTVVVLRQWDQDFLNTTLTGGLLSTRNYSTGEGVAFEKIESSNKGYWNLGTGGIIDFAKSPFTWQTSKQYNNVGILKGDKNHGKPLCVGSGLSGGQQCGRFAIWELVFLDHDATEEELTKIKDYFVKTYPWLFPDQAWTVTGKTNEDEDRATIANITGNGNDLVLSNFGFAEGSGYNEEGEYAGYLVTDGVDDKIISSIFKMGNDWTVIGDWELINTGKNDNAGIVKFDSIVIYNYNSMLINIKNGRNILIPDQNTVNAICSDGRIYSKDWKESIYNEETESTSKNFLTIGYSGNTYTKIAFKNLAIYPTVLSREDCIKAYNYLQTLKAK